jgi:hypothetical protein
MRKDNYWQPSGATTMVEVLRAGNSRMYPWKVLAAPEKKLPIRIEKNNWINYSRGAEK